MKKLDNKGFTLVEVIAVVVILSVLSLLIVPSISGLLNRSKENSYSDLINFDIIQIIYCKVEDVIWKENCY